jgi:hypothetical protein
VGSDGFFALAFESEATNLDSNLTDDNDFQDIYVRLPTLNKTFLLSVLKDVSNNPRTATGRSLNPSIGYAEAKKELVVAFATDANEFRALDQNGLRDVFIAVVDLPTLTSAATSAAAITIESVDAGQGLPEPNGASDEPSVSGDGRYVAFSSFATNLTSDTVSASFQQIYLFDRQTKAITLVSKSASGIPGDGTSSAPSLNFSGRYITYLTQATNLVDGNQNRLSACARYDITTGTTLRVDALATGEAANNAANDCSISANGRFAAFTTLATNLASDDTSDIPDVYLRDFTTGQVTRISRAQDGSSPDGHAERGFLSGSSFNSLSGALTFVSDASNLVAGDTFLQDIFVTPITIPAPPLTAGTKIEVPPDVTITGASRKKTITLSLQPFDLNAATSGALSSLTSEAARANRVVYDVRLERKGRKRDNQQKLSKRSQVAFRKVPKGSYTARYRAIVMRGKKIITRTPFSPRRPVTT